MMAGNGERSGASGGGNAGDREARLGSGSFL
ncbi:hypothetical protein CFP59_05148 [Streptomyces malaysiensis subsp. malaysiensis]|nr:hypothetical protein CFP59_05148 [Streptomyces sp. M56]